MTDAELDAIRARLEKATPGPWVAHKTLSFQPAYVTSEDADVGAEMLTVDATFIAHARTDIPALLDELATAREENERLRRDVVRLESAVRDVVAQRVGVDNPRTGRYLEDLNFALLEHLRSALNETTTTDWSKSYALHSATEDADEDMAR